MNDINPLSQNFTIKSLLKFAFPTILMMIFMGLYTVADTIFVARFVDTNALSALNIVCPVINLTVGLGTMLATGGSAIIARKIGAGEHTRAAQNFTLIISAGVLFGMLMSVLGTVFIDRIIWGLGANLILFPYCKEYLFILLLFTPASILQVLFQNLIVTAGRPGIGMMLGVSAGITNILLDYFFIMIKLLGENGVAAITIIIYTQFLLSTLYIGFSMGVAPVISYNYGKQDKIQLKKVFSICIKFILFVSVSVFEAAFILGSPLVGIFAEKGTPVYEIARDGFFIFPFCFLFCGLNIFTSATFTALSNGKLSAILSFLRTFALITVLLLTLPNLLGVTGIWLAVPIAELITMIVALVFLQQNREKYLDSQTKTYYDISD